MKPAPVCLSTHLASISPSHLKARHQSVSHKPPNLRKAKATSERLWLTGENGLAGANLSPVPLRHPDEIKRGKMLLVR